MSWNNVAKPTNATWTDVPKPHLVTTLSGGEPIGLLIALTYTVISQVGEWTNISKPSNPSWNKIVKPTS